MNFSVTLFSPSHYWWRAFKDKDTPRAWFYRPDDHSGGGVGFCIPGLHIVFMWGRGGR